MVTRWHYTVQGQKVSMKKILTLYLVTLFFASIAEAAVTLEEHILQKGVFRKFDCKPDASDPGYDACQCEADIRYPEIKGLKNLPLQESLNAEFRKGAEQVKCGGVAITDAGKKPEEKQSAASMTRRYEVTFQSPAVMGLKFTDGQYGGGAHGNVLVTGIILDLEQEKRLKIMDMISPKNILAINQLIYDALSAHPEGEVFHDQIESRKGAFIHDGKCEGCTLLLTPEGLKVVFQMYEIAPYASGNVEVVIPEKYITVPAIARVQEMRKETSLKANTK